MERWVSTSRALFSDWACLGTMRAMVLSWQPIATSWSQNIHRQCRCGSLASFPWHIPGALLDVYIYTALSDCRLACWSLLLEVVSKAGVGMASCRAQVNL